MQAKGQIAEKLASKSGKTAEEMKQLIEEKRAKFSGLLTETGAAYMVAKDLGIDLGDQGIKRLKISQLKEGMQNIDLLARAMQVFPPKQYERDSRKGILCNLIVADQTGETRLTLWHDDVKKMLEKGVKRGTVLLLKNCYVKSFNEKTQVSLGHNGSLEANPKNTLFEDLPEAESKLTKIAGIRQGMNNVNLNARILRKFPAKEFEKGERKGKVMNFQIADETGSIRATAWNDTVDQTQNLKENQLIGIEGAYTKQGLRGTELHLGWQARILEKVDAKIPGREELLLSKATKKKITGLKPGEENVQVEGKIVSVNPGSLYYNVCPKCNGKLQALEEGTVCEKCGEVKEPEARPVISVRIDDGSAQINVTAFGKEAEKIIGLDKNELKRQADERGRQALIEELQAIAGRKITAAGKVKQNDFSGEMEITANTVKTG